jgi:tripartite-type tricarboxylate transporter receptor subunit TctC
VRAVPLPTNGASEAMLAVLGKHVEVAIMGGWYPNYAAGKVRVLAETGPYKIPGMANVPTLKELGYPVVLTTFVGLAAPAGTPPEVAERWQKILPTIIDSPRFREFLDGSKQTPAYQSAKEFSANIVREYKVASGLAKELGLERK